MPTLDATSSKHNNEHTEPQQLELCNTIHKSHNDNKIQKYNKKLQMYLWFNSNANRQLQGQQHSSKLVFRERFPCQ